MSQYFHQPNIDPVIFHLWGPLQIRWYSILYVGGFLVGRFILQRLAREKRFLFNAADMEQFIVWVLVSAVVGARVIYCVVYDPATLLKNPFYLFQTYKGGLSFHGGLLGVIIAGIYFARKKKIPFWNLADAMAIATPIGLAMGRIGNFINGELYGRVTDVPWAVIFRDGGALPRHPSQLYEFFLEGIVLFSVLWFGRKRWQKDGQLSILFLVLYTSFRFFVEFFREPDAHLGYLALGLSMGQILSLVMLLISLAVGYVVLRQPAKETSKKKR